MKWGRVRTECVESGDRSTMMNDEVNWIVIVAGGGPRKVDAFGLRWEEICGESPTPKKAERDHAGGPIFSRF